MKCSMAFSKKILFSHSVSSASISKVCRAMHGSLECLKLGLPFSGGLSYAGRELFQNPPCHFLNFAKAGEVLLKLAVQIECRRGIELGSQNHVAQMNGMRQH